jgi:hypothetical protein
VSTGQLRSTSCQPCGEYRTAEIHIMPAFGEYRTA